MRGLARLTLTKTHARTLPGTRPKRIFQSTENLIAHIVKLSDCLRWHVGIIFQIPLITLPESPLDFSAPRGEPFLMTTLVVKGRYRRNINVAECFNLSDKLIFLNNSFIWKVVHFTQHFYNTAYISANHFGCR